jgi:GTPase SAR1 family protein
VYDVTRAGTFDAVKKWKADIDDNLNTDSYRLPVILLANKCDLVEETQLDPLKMDEYCRDSHFLAWSSFTLHLGSKHPPRMM